MLSRRRSRIPFVFLMACSLPRLAAESTSSSQPARAPAVASIARVRVADFVVGRPNVEVQCCDLAAPTIDETVPYKGITGFVDVQPGSDAQLRLRLYGDTEWTTKTVTIPRAGYFVIAFFQRGQIGDAVLLETPPPSSAQSNDPPKLRLFNLSPDSQPATLVSDPGTSSEKVIVRDIASGRGSAHEPSAGPAGARNFKVTSQPGVYYVDNFHVEKAGYYTVILIGHTQATELYRPEAIPVVDR